MSKWPIALALSLVAAGLRPATEAAPSRLSSVVPFSSAGVLLAAATPNPGLDYVTLKAQAEKLYADRSFALAREAYQKAAASAPGPEEKRWVEFRLADTEWRSQAATENPDSSRSDAARQQLEAMVRDRTRTDQHDRTWAEVEESLADYWWTRRNNQNWPAALPYYQQALDWWAGAPDIGLARQRYLSLVWRMAKPAGVEAYYYYGYYGNYVPLEVLDNALKIAQTENDKAHAHYLLAMTLRNQGGEWDQRARVVDEFEAALNAGKQGSDWYDDALYHYAEWLESQGRALMLKDGTWTQQPDYVRALELFRKLVKEFAKGETRYWEQAQDQIRSITEPQVGVSVQHVFLPDSEISYYLNWRNVKRVDLALYPVELNRDAQLRGQESWLSSIQLGSLEKLKAWSKEIDDTGEYKPGNENLRLNEKLKPGAYVLEATGGGKTGRDLILVSDASLVLKLSGKQALLYFCDALDSESLGGAAFKLWERWHDGQNWQVRQSEKRADNDGLALFELAQRPQHQSAEIFASVILKDRQAFAVANSYWPGGEAQPWRVYAYTDRPAYRPKETVQWKFIARTYNGSVYATPADQVLEFQIQDPHGANIKEDKLKLNAFGSGWGTLDVTEKMPLGEYRVTFWDEGKKRNIGQAVLFRLEEYKLPEFKVAVQTPEEGGRKKTFRLGEKVEVNVQADYYFGGPVANASVELLVYQNPFYHYWHSPREYPWFYDDMDLAATPWGRWYGGGPGQIIKRETLKTDATGKASLTFDTPRNSSQDFEYRVEARVTDSSRREISGNGTVRVTRQRYYVYADPGHCLYRPQDKAAVTFKALDANEQPVQTDGLVKVTRDYWFEVWLDPQGKEVKGEALTRARALYPVFPPPPLPNKEGWKVKFRGYEHDEVLTRALKTDTNGIAELTFTPEREGYYRVAWTGEDALPSSSSPTRSSGRESAPSSRKEAQKRLASRSGRSRPYAGPTAQVTAQTTVWVATGASTDLGYRHGGVEIIVDKDTFHAGQKAPVMLVTPTNGRNVLFTVEGEDLYHYQLVRLDGTVKLIELPIEEKYVPNIFLGATLVSDRQLFVDTKQVVIPPTKNFLTVEVKPDRPQYQPQEQGTFTITTRNDEGRPIPAEVSFGLVDESVFYIQHDYAGDPRQHFFGTKRQQQVQTQSTMNQKAYARLVQGEQDQLIDELTVSRQAGAYFYDSRDDLKKELADKDVSQNMPAAAPMSNSGMMGGGGGAFGGARMSRAAVNRELLEESKSKLAGLDAAKPSQAQEPTVQVRSDFRSTIVWQPDVSTGPDGTATVKVKYPDSLTSWKATARAVSQVNQFGIADSTTRTKMPLIVRLQAPRFFVTGDTVTLSAVINNNTDQAMEVRVALESTGGLDLASAIGSAGALPGVSKTVTVSASGESRVDWPADVKAAGDIKLKVTARSGQHSDAMVKSYTVYEHGIEKLLAKSGKVRGREVTLKLPLPKERKAGSTTLNVQITPSLAVTMLDALPYLIDYPYGCTEQTMSRFLPAAITAKTLKDLGLQPEDVMSRLFGGIEPAHADATHPKGKKELAELDKIVSASLDRLYDFQHPDGGWGWWKQGDSDHWMTAYVVWGLTLARDAGVKANDPNAPPIGVDPKTGLPVVPDRIERGAAYLDKTLVEEEENPDMQAWMLHALAVRHQSLKLKEPSQFQARAFENLWNSREKLNAYTRALLALTAHYFGKADQARTLIQNLENGIKRDDRPDTSVLVTPGATAPSPASVLGTAHWGEDGIYWRWSEGGVEATAFALRALLAIDPQNKLIEPVTNWLIKNRRGAQWNSTRDTAIVVLAMNDYLRVSGELNPDVEYELLVNGKSVAKKKLSGADVFSAPSRFAIDPKLILDNNEIKILTKLARGSGQEPSVYFAAEARFFSLEEPITPAGNEIFARREYYKLVGRPTLLKGYVYDREPLRDGEIVKSGERVETLVTIETKNNLEYLVFEDLKPAGLEAVAVRSGESLYARELKSAAVERKFATNSPAASNSTDESNYTSRSRWVHEELRDRKVALFLDKLPEGIWEIRYDLRAEVPGRFHALPVTGYAMYVPEIRCNGAEVRLEVQDKL